MYANNNPLKYIDPTGMYLLTPESSKFKEAYDYLSRSETFMKYYKAVDDLPDIVEIDVSAGQVRKKSEGNFYFDKRMAQVHGLLKVRHPDEGHSLLQWNSEYAMEVRHEAYMSAAMALAHEVIHAYRELIDGILEPLGYDKGAADFIASEEAKVTEIEKQIALELYEYFRNEYSDNSGCLKVDNPTYHTNLPMSWPAKSSRSPIPY